MFEDQVPYAQRVCLLNGIQQIRFVYSPRTGTGEERAAFVWTKLIEALTKPLTGSEKEKGRYDPPTPPRVIYEGTLLDAKKFFNQSMPIAACGDCPIGKYTDGLPIEVPTEAAVKEMLTGTSHSADEIIYSYSMNTTTKPILSELTRYAYFNKRYCGRFGSFKTVRLDVIGSHT